jgi:hypothetical protein
MNTSITARLALLLTILAVLKTTASADIAPRPPISPPVNILPPQQPQPDAGLPDIRLDKRISVTLADQGKATTLVIPKAWLTAKTSTTQPDAATPSPHAAANRSAAIQTALAGLILGAVCLLASWQLLQHRHVNSTLLSIAGAVIVLLLAGAAQADLAVPPGQTGLQTGPGQTSGQITLQTTDTGDIAQLTLSRDIVHTLFASTDHH